MNIGVALVCEPVSVVLVWKQTIKKIAHKNFLLRLVVHKPRLEKLQVNTIT